MDISQQHCLVHPMREAVARCPECGKFFCRECVTEHEDRVICTACLKKIARENKAKGARLAWLGRLGASVAGITVAWLFFYWTGQALLSIPAKYHDGTVWNGSFWDE